MSVNWCGMLQGYAVSKKCIVEYLDLSPPGPQHDHDLTFHVKVKLYCNDRPEAQAAATGTGTTKEDAKAQAAQAWLRCFGTLRVSRLSCAHSLFT